MIFVRTLPFMIALRRVSVVAAFFSFVACGGKSRNEGFDVSRLSTEQRADYELFARRCSKCHSLARPLGSGIDDDEHWERYFERMRLIPGSGLYTEDKGPILRFLHVYSMEQRRKQAEKAAALSPAPLLPETPSDGGAE